MGGNIPGNLRGIFISAGQANHVAPEDLAGIASVETNLGSNRATSSTGAQGLMQFEPYTAAQFHNDPAHNDAQAINDAARLLNQYGYQQNRARALAAYNAGPHNVGAGAGYAKDVMNEAARLKPQLLAAGMKALGGKGGGFAMKPAFSGVPMTSLTGGQTDVTSAGIDALLGSTSSKFTGKFKASDPLGKLLSNLSSGNYTTPSSAVSKIVSQVNAQKAALNSSGVNPASIGGKGGDINPLGAHGWVIGRTDMGVDASAPIGTPIRAMNNSRVVDIQHNWYAGQPLVLMQLTSGPNAGKYWYISEQINHNLHVGQTVARGQTVATYAPHGTAIEIGWGHPGGGDTLAGFTGQTGDATHGNAPAGIHFHDYALKLPAS